MSMFLRLKTIVVVTPKRNKVFQRFLLPLFKHHNHSMIFSQQITPPFSHPLNFYPNPLW